MLKNCFVAVFILLATSFRTSAQEIFVEGTIQYKVATAVPGTTTPKPIGTYIITVKGNMIRKEFVLDNGYKNTLIYNGNTSTYYSLKSTPAKNYAIQLNFADLKSQYKKYEDFKIEESKNMVTIAGFSCVKAVVTYTNKTTSNVSICKQFSPSDAFVFEQFPGIKYIPLYFEYTNEQGGNILFTAEKFEKTPVETALFRVPGDYKIITNEEYKLLNK